MNQKELEALAEKYQKKADTAYQNYQETGTTRYDRERRINEELAEALRMAANAADDHAKLIHMRATVTDLAAEAEHIGNMPEDRKATALEALRKNLLAAARLEGLSRG